MFRNKANPSVEYTEEEYKQLTEYLRTKERAKDRQEIAEEEIRRLVERMELTDAAEEQAIDFYSQVLRTDLINNYSAARLTAAVVYLTCREMGIPRTTDDVLNASYVNVENRPRPRSLTSPRSLRRLYRHIRDKFGRSYLPIEPQKFGQRYCEELDLDGHVQKFVRVVLNKVEDEVPGRASGAVAAGAISYASDQLDLDITDREICKITGFSDTTVREIRDEIEIIVGELKSL